LAICWGHLGQTWHLQQDYERAEQAYETACQFLSGTEQALPGNQNNLALILENYAVLLADADRLDEASDKLSQAQSLWKQLATRDQAAPEHIYRWATFLADCPLSKARDPEAAVALARKLTERVPENAIFWNTLGVALLRTGDHDAAVKALEEAQSRRSAPHGRDLFFLAMARFGQDERDEAEQCYQRGLDWMEKNRPHSLEFRRVRDEASSLLQR
jgi:tetratricopeptide (TPR) repeat protein